MNCVPAFVTMVVVLAAGGSTAAEEARLPPDTALRAETIAQDGAWCWFADPRAVRQGDTTYISYITAIGDIMISAYDHRAGRLATVRLHEKLKQMGTTKDDHGNPSMLIRSDGRIMVFYSGHSTPPMYCRVSKAPLDISARRQWLLPVCKRLATGTGAPEETLASLPGRYRGRAQ